MQQRLSCWVYENLIANFWTQWYYIYRIVYHSERIGDVTMHGNRVKRMISALLCLAMLASYLPVSGFAEESENVCTHHSEHVDCGYEEGVPDCSFVCEICTEATAGDTEPEETSEPTDTTQPTESEPGSCEHHPEHIDCGYVEGVSGCDFVCEICTEATAGDTEPEETSEPTGSEPGSCEHHTEHMDCGYEEGVSDCGFVCEVCTQATDETVAQEEPLVLTASWVNPMYGDSVELPQPAGTPAFSVFGVRRYYTDAASAGEQIRGALVDRAESVTIGYRIPAEQFTEEGMGELGTELFDAACVHTGVPVEGDYLRWHSLGWSISATSEGPSADGTYYDSEVTLTVYMFTTPEQEAAVTTHVNSLLNILTPSGTDYQKLKTVYDWICSHITYDYANLEDETYYLKHSAYAAIVDRTAVCQGYATLLYRLALEMGIDCRVITGTSFGENHAWNIIRIGDRYYNLDSTWDADYTAYGLPYEYFLKCNTNFPDHNRAAEYTAASFQKSYPMGESDYEEHTSPTKYVDGDFVYIIQNGTATLTSYTGKAADVTIPDTANGYPVTKIGNQAFFKNSTLTRVTLPATVQEIESGWKETDWDRIDSNGNVLCTLYGAFSYCKKLKEVIIPGNSELHTIGIYAFAECINLTDIEFPGSIRELKLSCFEMCTSLTSVVLPEGLETLEQNAFTMAGLNSIHIPASCTYIHRFNNLPSLEAYTVAEGNPRYRAHEGVLYDNEPITGSYTGWTLINYPQSKPEESYRVAEYCTHIYGEAFMMQYRPKCLKTLYIGNAVSTLGTAGGDSFARIECSIIPDDTNPYYQNQDGLLLTTDGKTLVQVPRIFTGTVTIPEGVEILEEYLFWYYDTISYLIIPESVKVIYSSTLGYCDGLKELFFEGDMPEIRGEPFWWPQMTIYYPGDNPTWKGASITNYPEDRTIKLVPYGLMKPVVTVSVNNRTGDAVLKWNAIGRADGYEVYRATSKSGTYTLQGSRTTDCEFEVDVPAGKTYYYKVKAVCSEDSSLSSYSDVVKITGKLAQPQITVTNTASTGKVKISWPAVKNVEEYKVYRATSEDGTYSLVKTTTATSYTDSTAKVGTTYYYKVKAMSSNSSAHSAYSQILPGIRDLVRPTVEVSNVASTGKIKLTWAAVTGTVGYEVYRAEGEEGEYALVTTTDALTWTDSTAVAGTTYSYRVKALAANEEAHSALSAVDTLTCDLARTTLTLSTEEVTGRNVATWTAVEGATYYRLYRATSKTGTYSKIAEVEGTTFTDTTATAGKTYYYKVRAYMENTDATSAYSTVVSRACRLAQPQITVANTASTGKVKISWPAVKNVKEYKVYRATSEDGTYSLVKTTTSTSYTDGTAKVGTTYYYKVRAMSSTTAAHSAYSEILPGIRDLVRPTVEVSNVASTGKIKLTWAAVTGTVGYEIYRAEGEEGEYALVTTTDALTWTDSTAVAGTAYSYRVKALAENEEAHSALSAVDTLTCKLPRPNVSIALSSKKPNLTWDAVEGAVSYKVYRSTSKTGTYSLVKTTTDTSYTDTKATAGKTYYYKVKAVAEISAATSAYSAVDYIKSK